MLFSTLFRRLGLVLFGTDSHLTVVQHTHDEDSANNVSECCREQPAEVIAEMEVPRHDCCHNFGAAGNAVGEVSGADDEGQHPGDHDLRSEEHTSELQS